MLRILFTILLSNVILFGIVSGQENDQEKVIQYLKTQHKVLGLDLETIDGLILSDHFSTQHNGAQHFYFQQSHRGIPVFNATLNVTQSRSGKIIVSGNRLIDMENKQWDRPEPAIEAAEAIRLTAEEVYPSVARSFALHETAKLGQNSFSFQAPEISNSDIPVKLTYVPSGDKLSLCWNLELDVTNNADFWQYNIDATTGDIVNKHNYTTYCSFDLNSFSHRKNHGGGHADHQHSYPLLSGQALTDEASYLVFPFPAESPNHMEQRQVDSPADPIASPFGWHDTDGVDGPEYTITRGNNVHAYLDEFDQDSPSADEPDGGDSLKFLFPFDKNAEAENLKDAAVVNLFYANNRVHDMIYRLGFDEAAGNFQKNNYGKGGVEEDYVNAQAFDGGGENNANFSTPSDGNNGRMQMYLWSGGDQLRLEINHPLEISGLYETGKASFGPDMDINLIEGKVVIAQDDSNKPNLGCGDIENRDELEGNIALIDRGVCEFGSKVLHAEEAGAIAVLICNVEGVNGGTGDELIDMAPGQEGEQVSIPSLFAKKTTCDLIKIAIQNENEVEVTMGLQQLPGPSRRAGSFDNGVVIHEYTHGISTRLSGGPNNSGCLSNDEQMGEGWSDFYALAFTTQEGDLGVDARGIGTYASGQQITGRGIRHYPYSTDMSISPVTYDFIKTTNIPHGVGEVWAAALWDLYWEFINLYGFDPSWTDTESGNFKALLIVTDALKMQSCNPGFLDGRDAIINADQVTFDGEHECLIWEVFARRGMGYYADQGDPFSAVDGSENFDSKPTCIPELKLRDSYADMVVPGEKIDVSVTAINHKPDSVTQVKIVEDLPTGLTYVEGSASVESSVDGSKVTFDLGTLQQNEEMQIEYQLEADPSIYSTQQFLDDMEEDEGNWFGLNNEGDDTFWEWSDIDANSGEYSWYVAESETVSDLSLIMLYDAFTIEGSAPALSFYHAFNTETLADGGFVEYSTDEGETWNQFSSDDFILNAYSGPLSYNTIAIPGLEAFYGKSDGFIRSFIDLSFLKGEEVIFSFRYGTDDNTIVSGENPGWFIDDVELVDLKKYERNICIESAEGDNRCLDSEILIDSRLPDATETLKFTRNGLLVGPNPTTDQLNLYLDNEKEETVKLSLISLDGKAVYTKAFVVPGGKQRISVSTAGLQSGLYWLQYKSNNSSRSVQIVVE
jgi:extracellular elastinolytic metalloproteinase